MASPNFATILDESPAEVERPKPLPEGTYLCTVGNWESGESSQKKTPFVKFALHPIAAMEGVDPAALNDVGGVEGKNLSVTFYITEDAKYMLDEFHENCGIDLSDGAPRRQRNDDVANAQVLAVVTHDINSKDPSRVYAKVSRTAIAD